MKAFLYRACAIIFSHFVLYPDYRISFFIPLAFRFADYKSEVYPLKARKEGGEVMAELPEDWESANCEFYTFARNQEGTQTSRTSYLQLVTL